MKHGVAVIETQTSAVLRLHWFLDFQAVHLGLQVLSMLVFLQGDHVALLSAFAEMGLKLRLDMPEQAMEVTSVFFRTSTPSSEAVVSFF